MNLEEEVLMFRHFIIAPPKLPEDVKGVLSGAIERAVRDPQFAEQMAKTGYPMVVATGAELTKIIDRTAKAVEKYKEFVPKE
jgi:tripartite-type tricarboxylate transporter receptor subunit TctC